MSALKSVFTPVMAVKWCLPSSATNPGMSRGLGIRTFFAPIFMKVRQFPVSAKMWYIGSAVITVSRPSSRPVPTQFETCIRFATRLPWVSIAPFETPVVPPVYCRKAMSSSPIGGGARRCDLPAASASGKVTRPGRLNAGTIFFTRFTTKLAMTDLGKPSMSPIWVVTIVFTFVRGNTSSSVFAKFSSMTMASAPESTSWCSSSRGVYRGLQFTPTSPARSRPKMATGYCSRFGIIRATRAPLPRPAEFCSQLPKSVDSRSSSR